MAPPNPITSEATQTANRPSFIARTPGILLFMLATFFHTCLSYVFSQAKIYSLTTERPSAQLSNIPPKGLREAFLRFLMCNIIIVPPEQTQAEQAHQVKSLMHLPCRSSYNEFDVALRAKTSLASSDENHKALRQPIAHALRSRNFKSKIEKLVTRCSRNSDFTNLTTEINNLFCEVFLGLPLPKKVLKALKELLGLFSLHPELPALSERLLYWHPAIIKFQKKFDEACSFFFIEHFDSLAELIKSPKKTLLKTAILKALDGDDFENLDQQEIIFLSEHLAVRNAISALFPMFNVARIIKRTIRDLSTLENFEFNEGVLDNIIAYGLRKHTNVVSLLRYSPKALPLTDTAGKVYATLPPKSVISFSLNLSEAYSPTADLSKLISGICQPSCRLKN